MRLFRKVSFVLLAISVFLPAISAILPQIVGTEGEIIKSGNIQILEEGEGYAIQYEDGTWAEYLAKPLLGEGGNGGVANAFAGVLYHLQNAGMELSTPVACGAGISLAAIVLEIADLIASLVMWIPRRITAIFERS